MHIFVDKTCVLKANKKILLTGKNRRTTTSKKLEFRRTYIYIIKHSITILNMVITFATRWVIGGEVTRLGWRDRLHFGDELAGGEVTRNPDSYHDIDITATNDRTLWSTFLSIVDNDCKIFLKLFIDLNDTLKEKKNACQKKLLR